MLRNHMRAFVRWKRAETVILLVSCSLILALTCLLLLGWPPPDRPLTPRQVSRIEPGMTEAEIMRLLGEPSEPLDLEELSEALRVNGRGWRWQSGSRRVDVYFINGKVAGSVVNGYE
jgi:hypothetical protein